MLFFLTPVGASELQTTKSDIKSKAAYGFDDNESVISFIERSTESRNQ